MEGEQTRLLLKEAGEAAHPERGALNSYQDLQDLLGKLAAAMETLLLENERLSGRLRRRTIDLGVRRDTPPIRPL